MPDYSKEHKIINEWIAELALSPEEAATITISEVRRRIAEKRGEPYHEPTLQDFRCALERPYGYRHGNTPYCLACAKTVTKSLSPIRILDEWWEENDANIVDHLPLVCGECRTVIFEATTDDDLREWDPEDHE